MVIHMVFTPVFFFDSEGVSQSGRGVWVVLGTSLAAGPFELSVLGCLFFFFFIFFVFRDDGGSGLVAAAALEVEGAA